MWKYWFYFSTNDNPAKTYASDVQTIAHHVRQFHFHNISVIVNSDWFKLTGAVNLIGQYSMASIRTI